MANKRGRSTSNDFDESENNEFQPDYETKSYKPKRAALRVDNDETEVPNIMEMSEENRIDYIKQNGIDSYNYPQHYKDLIKREMSRRNLQGFENLKDITNEQIFQRTPEQYGRLTRIQNLRNVNCIKSRDNSEMDMDSFGFTDKAIHILTSHNIQIPPNFSEYKSHYQSLNNTITFEEIKRQYDIVYPSNKYQLIVKLFKIVFGDLSQYMCLAGGFALSMYIYQNYGYTINFGDIDIFIHSCDEFIANQIIQRLNVFTGKCELYENGNVVSSYINDKKDGMLYFVNENNDRQKHLTIQIIRRLYTCPQQVITGFDIDSCCILTTLDGQIYTTERGYNSIERGYNVINFYKYSPSYISRLLKYNKRGFGIWIPFIFQFIENAVFDVNYTDKHKDYDGEIKELNSNIIIDDLLGRGIMDICDYNGRFHDDNHLGYDYSIKQKFYEFSKLDLDCETNNTFKDLTIFEDPKVWYPTKPENFIDMVEPLRNIGHEIVEIKETGKTIYARNIVRRNLIYNGEHLYKRWDESSCMKQVLTNFLQYIYHICPDIIICGEMIQQIVTNNFRTYEKDDNPDENNIIYSRSIVTEEQKLRFMYEFTKYKILLSLYVEMLSEKDCPLITDMNDIGTVIFFRGENGNRIVKKKIPETDEENFHNFCLLNSTTMFRQITKENYNSNSDLYLDNYNYMIIEKINVCYNLNHFIDINFTFMNIEVTFEEQLNNLENEEDRAFFFSDGKFYGCNYENQKISILVVPEESEILDYPAVENYVPS